MKLDLGCSETVRPGFVGVDRRKLDIGSYYVRTDLDVYPWPWASGDVDEIYASHIIEHLADPLMALAEIARILKPGGLLTIIVPHARSWTNCSISHHSTWTHWTFKTLLIEEGIPFRQLSFRARVTKRFWTPLDPIMSRWPRLTDQFCPLAPVEIEWKGVRL